VQPQLVCIPADSVELIWPGKVHDLIDSAFAASNLAMPTDILDQLRSGSRQLWLGVTEDAAIVAAATTQIFEMREGRACKLLECGATTGLHNLAALRAGIEQYAKHNGCDRMLLEGRRGWERAAPDYVVTGIILEKRI